MSFRSRLIVAVSALTLLVAMIVLAVTSAHPVDAVIPAPALVFGAARTAQLWARRPRRS